MPHFIDQKINSFLDSGSSRWNTLASWLEWDESYLLSEDENISAIESVFFSMKYAPDSTSFQSSKSYTLEGALLPVLAKMEYFGVHVDRDLLIKVSEELRIKSKVLESEIYALAGEIFNPASAKQVQYILYEKLGIGKGKKIKTGYSVDSETLEAMREEHPIASLLLEFRTYEKLRSTYTEWLQKEIWHDGRIHTTYKQSSVATGRLASESPNLQNIPSGSGYPNIIKSAFRPKEANKVFVVADYSQVELRILAMLSKDPVLIEAFVKKEDIHARTARFLFGEKEHISSEERRIAKAVNFWVIYGITGFGLSKMIKWSPKEANMYIDAFFEKYQWVRTYYTNLLENARKNGYVETYFGRKRIIKWLTDANSLIRQWAEREAMNAPIQWTAAEVIKYAMIELDARLEKELPEAKMLMQVHDELVFEVPKDESLLLQKIIQEVMEWVLPHEHIVLKVDIGEGVNWSEAKAH